MEITGTHIAYYFICHRKLWLYAKGIRMEHSSGLVAEGKLIGEQSYPQRAARWQEVLIGGSRIDFYDPVTGSVHEVKKSPAREEAHVAQLKYYLWLLRREGIAAHYGVLEYPKLRQTERVVWQDEDEQAIIGWQAEIRRITALEECPPRLPVARCQHCAYGEFCWGSEAQ